MTGFGTSDGMTVFTELYISDCEWEVLMMPVREVIPWGQTIPKGIYSII
jgi:hypothetical protein